MAAYSQEIARLQKRKAAAAARIERLTDEILRRMELGALRKADGWKMAIKEALERQLEVPGAKLVQRLTLLRR